MQTPKKFIDPFNLNNSNNNRYDKNWLIQT